MSDRILLPLVLAGAVGSGLMGGLFFTFSNTIMAAFDRLPPGQAIAAMQAINRVIQNPLFLALFMGTGLVCLALAALALPRLGAPAGWAILAGAALYLAGSIVVTMTLNVPLNNRLDAVALSAPDLAEQWRAYRGPWTQLNHLRTFACALAAGAFTLAAWLR